MTEASVVPPPTDRARQRGHRRGVYCPAPARSGLRGALMASRFVETFRTSLGRCLAAPSFLHDFYNLFIGSTAEGVAWKELDRLAARHAHSDLDVRPAHYDTWLECLLEAARQHDPEFSADVEDAWRKTLAPGIER